MMKSNWIFILICMSLLCLTTGCVEKPPVAAAWRKNCEFLITNTSDTPLHHVAIEVKRDVDENTLEEFIVTLQPHETKIYNWNTGYSPAAGGLIKVSCAGYSGKVRLRIKKQSN